MLLCAAACVVQYATLTQRQQELTALEDEAAPLYKRVEDAAKCDRQFEVLSNRESLLHALDHAGRPLQLLGIVSQSAAANAGSLRITDLAMETRRPRRPRMQQPSTPARSTPKSPTDVEAESAKLVELRLTGVSSDNLSVARFVELIRSYNVFDDVQLKSTDEAGDSGAQDFQVSCQYEE